jgi:enediyne polyketide synthase
VETVAGRTAEDWAALLGPYGDLARLVAERDASADTACTRVWTAMECLQKAGRAPRSPLALVSAERSGWVVFGSGDLRIATLATTVRDRTESLVIAILTEGRGDR